MIEEIRAKSNYKRDLDTSCSSRWALWMTFPMGWSGSASGFAAASFGAYGIDRGVADQFCRHEARNEELAAVVVELNGCAFGIGFGNDSQPVLLMFNLLSSGKNLHVASLSRLPLPGHCFLRKTPRRQDRSQRPKSRNVATF